MSNLDQPRSLAFKVEGIAFVFGIVFAATFAISTSIWVVFGFAWAILCAFIALFLMAVSFVVCSAAGDVVSKL